MSNRRRRKKRNIYLASSAIGISIILLLLAVGAYPLAIVNHRVVWASTYRSYVASALAYQQAAHDTYESTSTPLLNASAQGEAALGTAALDELIDQALVDDGLAKLVGNNTDNLVNNKIRDLSKEPQLPNASRALFQLDPNAFNDVILRPQATREVLTGRLFIDNKTLEQYMSEARASAKVHLLSSTYRWDGMHVQAQ